MQPATFQKNDQVSQDGAVSPQRHKLKVSDAMIGSLIRSVDADQIALLAQKMESKFLEGTELNPGNDFYSVETDEHEGNKVTFGQSADSQFSSIVCSFFKQKLMDDFQYGEHSGLYGSEHRTAHHYSFEDILSWDDSRQKNSKASSHSAREIVSNDAASLADYRILLSLDCEKTKKQHELIFVLTGTKGEVVDSIASFTLDDLETK